MEESLSSEHGGELFRDSLEELLNGRRIADESGGHLETAGRNVTHGGLDLKTQKCEILQENREKLRNFW